MFKAIRIGILLFILFFVAVNTWLTQARSTDWEESLWVKIYPINADGTDRSNRYIESLDTGDFVGIETFIKRETERYGKTINRPLRIELGLPIAEQPPEITPGAGMIGVMVWSLKMRWWASNTAGAQDSIDPDVRIFVRFHHPDHATLLENSVGLQKGMVGIVNAYASNTYRGSI